MSTPKEKKLPCIECGCLPPGHRISCKTGNDSAKAYQKKLASLHRAKSRKAKPAKKPGARPIPPPPPGWEIVGKDDPRLKDPLATNPMMFTKIYGWLDALYSSSENIFKAMKRGNVFALPIAQPAPASPPMIRLRLPSEKPTREDCDINGWVYIFWSSGECDMTRWDVPFSKNVVAWLPGRLPDGILPREPSQEEKWQAEFEEKFSKVYDLVKVNGEYVGSYTFAAWEGFLAAKKRGAK